MAERLGTGLRALPGADVLHAVEANILFCRLPQAVVDDSHRQRAPGGRGCGNRVSAPHDTLAPRHRLWFSPCMTLLVTRRHVDYVRVTSMGCPVAS
ncbi:hypothetical protein [Streptomyces sp. CdTB01]|uniref:hypothetical protein n=1 Tax=Streptomyces sp. CdTB01 TaxID=1725411 RepID=UPI00073AA974|nr:hypothetical protein [Streptomyces sp. CdTB01]ALV38052.1 hypothetical protein AS200_42945 [Streptomyces sp. CdTB01]